MKRIEKRRNKKTEKVKRLFVELIARLIYYSICSVIGCSAIILFLLNILLVSKTELGKIMVVIYTITTIIILIALIIFFIETFIVYSLSAL